MMTFVQATFVLATFVHIRNISAQSVTAEIFLILTFCGGGGGVESNFFVICHSCIFFVLKYIESNNQAELGTVKNSQGQNIMKHEHAWRMTHD